MGPEPGPEPDGGAEATPLSGVDVPMTVPGAALVDAEPARTAPRGRRRWWLWTIFIVLVLAVVVASRWNLNYYALLPGQAQSVQQYITVPADKSHPVTHPVLLTDVEIGRVTALTYLFYRLQSDSALEQVEAVTGGTPPSQLNAQGTLEMSQAEDDAKAAALTRLGYSVPATPSGAVIFGTYPGTPAYTALSVGDVVTAVDGVATPTAQALVTTLSRYHSGDTVRLTVRRGGTAPPAPVSITLKSTEVDVGGGQMVRLDLGIQPEDQVDFTYPFSVNIDVTNIGGPSAGLAMTLGVIDALTSGSVTGGRTVAATGTIDSQGDVGDVGGVAQKTVAVENAGASIFLVPPQEYKVALSKDRPGLKIYAVSTLDQALEVLAAHGGAVPPAPPTTAVPPAPAG
ncbi:MAG: S16 family serine protease [Acidimicrobiales bacterium]